MAKHRAHSVYCGPPQHHHARLRAGAGARRKRSSAQASGPPSAALAARSEAWAWGRERISSPLTSSSSSPICRPAFSAGPAVPSSLSSSLVTTMRPCLSLSPFSRPWRRAARVSPAARSEHGAAGRVR